MKETIIPMVPASGDDMPLTYRTIHTLSPETAEAMAPTALTRLLNSPQMNGPRKMEPMAL